MMTSRTATALASKAPSVSDKARLTRLALVLSTALTPVWGIADTLPTGGTVVHGATTIGAPASGTLTIDQSSDRAVVNWKGFSIGAGNQVNINQPSADSAILNRVTGDTTSQIHGQLNANGRVFVVNPNGIFIGATGSVNTGSFVASTLGIRTDDFAVGNTVFEGEGSSATVSNAGNIQVVTGGYAALIGGQVSNAGTIQAPMGFVGLGSGERITLDLGGDGFMQVAIPTDSDDPALKALIENSGTIQANGGTVQMSAATARTAARHAINMSGIVEARTVSGRNGRITLGGGGGGTVSVSGKVRTKSRRPVIQVTQSARPKLPPARGGDITITGHNITLTGAEIDASGTNGGGNIRIGGNLQGAAGLPTAQTLIIDATTLINADAITTGHGGRVIAWSDVSTDFAGSISVRGGELGGDGGFAEVSGKQNLRYTGLTDARAPNGETGELLLDPTDIEIVAGAPGTNQLQASAIETALLGADLTISTGRGTPTFPDAGETGTITVDAGITWSSGNTLRMDANDDIIVNAELSPSNFSGLVLDALDQVVVNADIDAPDSDLTIFAGTELNISPGADLTAQRGIITLDSLENVTVDGTIDTPGGQTFIDAVDDITFNGDFGPGRTNLVMTADNIDISGTITGSDSDYRIRADTLLDITGSITGTDTITELTSAGNIILNGPINTVAGPFSLGTLEINAGVSSSITVGDLGAVNVGLFQLNSGAWTQNSANLAAFDADNFVLQGGSFLRVAGGDGSTTPFGLTDVYGLQGAPTLGSSDFALANDIDASDSATWEALPGDEAPVTGLRDAGFVPLNFSATLDGQGNTISNLFIRRFNGTSASDETGLFATSSGVIRNLTIANADIAGPQVGAVAAQNDGLIDGVSVVNSTVTINVDAGGTSSGGGFVGVNGLNGNISESRAVNIAVTDASDPSIVGVSRAEDLFVGGIAGQNDGAINRVRSSGNVTYDDVEFAGRIGGIAGTNNGAINDAYVTATVSADTTAGDPGGSAADVGSISGTNGGTLTNVLANGPVSQTGPNPFGDVGAVTGNDSTATTSMVTSYFNPGTTGQALSGQNGEVDAGGLIAFEGARAQTTAELRDAAAFFENAAAAGWDFTGVWSFPQDGVDQARLYAVDPVISATDTSDPAPEFVYNATTDDHTAPGSQYSGGPTVYRFGPFGDMGDLTVMDDQIVLSDANVGPVTFTFPTSFTSDGGQAFDVRSFQQDASVIGAPLLILIDPATKAYGDEFTFADVSFAANTLFGSDAITSATVDSLGAPATATPDSYTLSLNTFVGTGLDNYIIEVTPSTLTVDPRALIVSVNSTSKTYGDVITFAGNEFVANGLVNGDTLTALTISSAGAPATATVAGSPYAITGGDPTGTGLGNYTLTITQGTLNVLPRPLSISVPSASKVYGETLALDSSNFTANGLVNGDTLTGLTLSSPGTAASAPVAGSPYAISATNPVGSGAENYALTVSTGTIQITPAPLTITADDQSKPFGTAFTFTGNEFTVEGLLNDDTVASAGLTSDATGANAPLTGEAGTAILIADPEGTGLDNYTITFVNGLFVVAPGDLIITANDITKVYGTELTFNGDEFTVAGLAAGDSVDSVTLVSAGAAGTANVAGSPYSIVASAAVGSGLDKYELVFADGSLLVIPAPLTVTALDQTKQQGQTFTWDGTEYATDGLLNGDSVDSAVFASVGASPDALAEDGPFAISIGDLTGSGLGNYDIASVEGVLTIQNEIATPVINPVRRGSSTLPNPPDTINVALPGDPSLGGVQESTRGSSSSQTLPQARSTFGYVDTISDEMELAIKNCGNADQDFANYMACLSESLDTYADALDEIVNDLPPGFENVSAVIRQARVGVDAAAARAERRLAGATTNAQRRAIRRDAINEARGAINEAKEEVRKAISLIRADDPEVAAVQRQTGARIVQAFDTVDSELVRAVEL